MKTKITIIVLAIFAVGALAFFGRSYLFTGRLVFFQQPTSTEVVANAGITHGEAMLLLTQAAERAGRITAAQGEGLRNSIPAQNAHTPLSRSNFAAVAAQVFNMDQFSYGPSLNDVSPYRQDFNTINLFVSNGGMPVTFKPDNPATREFANEAAESLEFRFSR